ncbi:hypothetical protein EMIHUDRAFT_111631 [Emiliania huxleyi CCMP1516]|uniref:NTF2 domain-containing protein n=2 Tax=Emiliania huxleyi TaxID=2903 RepID=A0A0D3KD02_EMIH1|nr:hypothetical protein EMIHUDRAFT_111631 [Emiliania huxleyi CCMP1516]EOD33637.1 hypothetical protein EMIHUDRAFT_111631 [Emiliania huxleyi CCMP1516]|eukprot:XP_005786066.1 hypothetical protein EMIHUDRAFT_111631 [Emiliania huxleyi CCMP1516]
MSADTGVEIELTSDFIANNFVEQYYAAIHKDPELVRKFYGADSGVASLPGLACIQHLVAQSSAEGAFGDPGRCQGNAMVTFTSQAAASFALKSFEEKPDIFTLEGKPDAGAGKPVRIEELKTFTERYPGGAPAGPRAGRAGGRGAEGRGEGRGSKGRGRGDGSRPPRSRSEASGDGGGKAAAAK